MRPRQKCLENVFEGHRLGRVDAGAACTTCLANQRSSIHSPSGNVALMRGASIIVLLFLLTAFGGNGLGYAEPITITPAIIVSQTSLNVSATVEATFEVHQVIAFVEGRSIALNYSCPFMRCGWRGTLSLVGLSRGNHTLTVSA